MPLYVFWELTRACNLRCIHCYAVRKRRPELSCEEALLVLRKLKRAKALVINLSGGEVFMRKDFWKIAEFARKEEFAIKIFTNGTMIGHEEVKRLSKLKPLCVDISLYSSVPEAHDTITGSPGSWKRSMGAIKRLKKEGLRVRIKYSVLRENFHSFSKTLGFITRLHVPFQCNPLLMPRVDGSSEPLRHSLRGVQRDFVVKTLSSRGALGEQIRRRRLSEPMCSAGINSCAINAYGDLMPCIAFPVKLGDVVREDFKKIWLHNRLLSSIREVENRDLPRCGRCELLDVCSRCPGVALLRKGRYDFAYREACQIAALRKVPA